MLRIVRRVVSAVVVLAAVLACNRIWAEPSVASPNIGQALVAIGFPQPLADYFAAVKITILSGDARSFSYRETYRDGATRDVVYSIGFDTGYPASPRELKDMRALGVHVLGSEFLPATTGSTYDEIRFFVPYDEVPSEVRESLQPSAGIDWPALLGIHTVIAQEARSQGLSVFQRSTIQEGSEQSFAQAMDMLGKGQALAAGISAAVDVAGAVSLHTETQAYYKLLDELERCARNPDHGVPVPEAERQQTLDTLARIRSELKRVTAVRFLNQVADAPLSLTGAAGPVGAAVGRAFSVALKPVATWSDEALQSYIRNTLLREAQAAVVPCRPSCTLPARPAPRLAQTAPQTGQARPASSTTPPSRTAPAQRSTPPASASSECDRDPDRVAVRFTNIERYDEPSGAAYLHRQASFRSSAVVRPSISGMTSRGEGSGTFHETAELAWPGVCVRRILTAADAKLTVEFQHQNREVLVRILSNQVYPIDRAYEEFPDNPHCAGYTGTQGGPDMEITCAFFDVDFDRGGVYHADGDDDYRDEDDHRLVNCELRIGPPPDEDEDEPPPPPADAQRFGAPIPANSGAGAIAVPPNVGGSAAAGTPSGAPAATRTPQGTSRYRVLLMGARAVATTIDNSASVDGMGDELFGVGVVWRWDRQLKKVLEFKLERTREYGDTGNPRASPQRIQAGRAGPDGGIAAGDTVPSGYDPDASTAASASRDQFPLLVWEGTLNAATDALVMIPSLWERDTGTRAFDAYRLAWLTAPLTRVMAQPVIVAELVTPTLGIVKPPEVPAVEATTLVGGDVTGRYVVVRGISSAPGSAGASEDRPIGIDTWADVAAVYAERYVVLTPEKLVSLPAGGNTILRVPLVDTVHPALGGNYELFLRIERIQ